MGDICRNHRTTNETQIRARDWFKIILILNKEKKIFFEKCYRLDVNLDFKIFFVQFPQLNHKTDEVHARYFPDSYI